MAKITRNILIKAPVEKVYEYLSEPKNMLEWHPSVIAIRNISGRGENQQWSWDYKLMGLIFKGRVQVTRSVTNTERTIKTTGGLKSTRTWRFAREAGGTRLDYELEYKIPTPVVGKVGEFIALQRSERVVDMAMANIKERMEG
ncbi:MAG: SRPBCC family protein [Chloroflexota bacterium]